MCGMSVIETAIVFLTQREVIMLSSSYIALDGHASTVRRVRVLQSPTISPSLKHVGNKH